MLTWRANYAFAHARHHLCPPRKDGLRLNTDRQPTYRATPDVFLSEKHWNKAGTSKS